MNTKHIATHLPCEMPCCASVFPSLDLDLDPTDTHRDRTTIEWLADPQTGSCYQ